MPSTALRRFGSTTVTSILGPVVGDVAAGVEAIRDEWTLDVEAVVVGSADGRDELSAALIKQPHHRCHEGASNATSTGVRGDLDEVQEAYLSGAGQLGQQRSESARGSGIAG